MSDYEVKTDPNKRRLVWDWADGSYRAYEWCDGLKMWIEVGTEE